MHVTQGKQLPWVGPSPLPSPLDATPAAAVLQATPQGSAPVPLHTPPQQPSISSVPSASDMTCPSALLLPTAHTHAGDGVRGDDMVMDQGGALGCIPLFMHGAVLEELVSPHYLSRQYEIKHEQAFACQQVGDWGVPPAQGVGGGGGGEHAPGIADLLGSHCIGKHAAGNACLLVQVALRQGQGEEQRGWWPLSLGGAFFGSGWIGIGIQQ
jgi:hypothetical protein